MPASWANALRPTMALFACTPSPVTSASSWLLAKSCGVSIPVWNAARSGRTRDTITTSSSDALPARSPMPLTVHSTCRAPPRTAARLFATASPRSSWQWVLKTTRWAPPTRSRIARKNASISSGVP